MNNIKDNNGFTLMELLAVIVLVIVVTGLTIAAVSSSMNKSRTKAFSNDTIVIAESALNKYADDRLNELFNNDLFNGEVSGKRCYSIESSLVGKFAKTANDSLKGSVEVCYADSCTYDTKVWLTNGEFFIDGEEIDENTNVKSKIKKQFTTPHYSSCGVDIQASKSNYEFAYTGVIDGVTIPRSGRYKLEVWGASGQDTTYFMGGYGGYSVGEMYLEKNTQLFIGVGGSGKNGGFNGGGTSNGTTGGGATHIALMGGVLSTLTNYRYDKVIIVAGGGGAAHPSVRCKTVDIFTSPGSKANGGHGGGYTGSKLRCNASSTGTSTCKFGASPDDASVQEDVRSGGGGGFMAAKADYLTLWNNCGDSGVPSANDGGTGHIAYQSLTNKHMATYKFVTKGSTTVNSGIENEDTEFKTIATECVSSTPTADCAKIGDGYAKITYLSAN